MSHACILTETLKQGSTDQNRLLPDQDRKKFRNRGPARTRTEKILEILDQLGPGPEPRKN